MIHQNCKLTKQVGPKTRKYDFEYFCESCCGDLLGKPYVYIDIFDNGYTMHGSVIIENAIHDVPVEQKQIGG